MSKWGAYGGLFAKASPAVSALSGVFASLGVAAGLLCALAVPAGASDVTCDTGGDAAGWSIAAGRDFDGDGISDVAMGAPCAHINGESNVGRVYLHSGVTGRRILTLNGSEPGQKFGGAIDFVDDMSGDGIADLVVGSLSWDSEDMMGTSPDAGKVDVFSFDGTVVLSVEGAYGSGNLGEAVAGMRDLDGDQVPDLLVGAGGDREFVGGDRLGVAYLLSGSDGSVIDMSLGDLKFDRWGAVVASVGADLNGDDVDDVIVSSNSADRPVDENTVEENNGLIRVLSGADLSQVLFSAYGDPEDKLGRDSAPVGDLDNDDLTDLAVGAPGITVGNAGNAGVVHLYSSGDGSLLRSLEEPMPQLGARFGSAVTEIESVNGDSISEIASGAPSAEVDGVGSAGRLHLFSGKNGNVLWTAEGGIPGARLGHSLTAVGDWDGDAVGDVAAGGPGDAFRARRGSGSVRILSGATGEELARFGGRLGEETRMLFLGRNLRGDAELRNVKSFGRKTKLRQTVLRGVRDGALSLAILDDDSAAAPNDLKIAVAAGADGSSSLIEVVRAGRRRGTLSRFSAQFSAAYAGGVNVAAGDLSSDDGFELAVTQADTDVESVELSIYRRIDTSPFGLITWSRLANFPVFAPDDMVDGFVVNAQGATVAVGTVSPRVVSEEDPEVVLDTGVRMIVGPERGTPVIRAFDATGLIASEWLAFPPTLGNSGTSIAIGNLDGSGLQEIVAIPRTGQLRVRAFNGDGTAFVDQDSGAAVDFIVPPTLTSFATDFRVGLADVDLDGKAEILILPNSDAITEVLAFELDGSTPTGWPNRVRPFGPISASLAAIATTDRFIRHR